MTDKLIVGIGEILWDILPESKKLGGAPANFAYHAAQSGLHSCVVSAVGNDLLGQEILENLENKKLNYQIAITPYPTGTVKVTVDNTGIPCYDIREQVAWDNIPYKSSLQELAKRTNAVCFGSLAQRNPVSRTTIQRFLNEMPEGENQYKIFDMNLRQSYYTREILHHSLRQCNVLKLNDEELTCVQQLFGYPHLRPETACKNLLATYSLEMLILTCGIQGSYVFTPTKIYFRKTPSVQVWDTVGAGDSFTATFCATLLKGGDIEKAQQLAVEVAAYVCTQEGAMPPLPDSLKY